MSAGVCQTVGVPQGDERLIARVNGSAPCGHEPHNLCGREESPSHHPGHYPSMSQGGTAWPEQMLPVAPPGYAKCEDVRIGPTGTSSTSTSDTPSPATTGVWSPSDVRSSEVSAPMAHKARDATPWLTKEDCLSDEQEEQDKK